MAPWVGTACCRSVRGLATVPELVPAVPEVVGARDHGAIFHDLHTLPAAEFRSPIHRRQLDPKRHRRLSPVGRRPASASQGLVCPLLDQGARVRGSETSSSEAAQPTLY